MSDIKKIKKLLIDREISQTELARRIRVALSSVNQVIIGKRKTRHIQEAIAKELKVKVERLFSNRRTKNVRATKNRI